MPIIWSKTDGSVLVTRIVPEVLERERRPNETTAQAVARLAMEIVQPKTPSLAGLTSTLVPEADISKDRSRRSAWRLKDGKVAPDATVPDPPRRLSLEERVAALEAKLPPRTA